MSPKKQPAETADAVRRSGTVAIVGRSNVGKSTLLNAALDLPLAIVTRKPQTTRDRLLGVVRHKRTEVGLLDTPGLHKATSQLGREMNLAAKGAVEMADVLVFVVALRRGKHDKLKPHRGDLALIDELPRDRPLVLVINKIDLIRDKRELLPLIEAFSAARELAAVVPISALREDGVTLVLDEVAKLLPKGEAQHDEDTVTTRPMRYFAREYVREAILKAAEQEIPHAVAITIDEFVEPVGDGTVKIAATIHVERSGQKGILVGKGGGMLRTIGTQARERLETLMEQPVYLKLWVRVTKNWRERPQHLADFGLIAGRGDGDA
jgi:GTP-binding protein Era